MTNDYYVLNGQEIEQQLRQLNMLIPVRYHNEVISTNITAKQDYLETHIHGVTVAGKQTGGKGRNGRSFASDFGGAYFTVSFDVSQESDEKKLYGSVLMAGLAVQSVLKDMGIDAKLKWPNDVLVNDKKICGILSEIVFDEGMPDYMLVGIGINVNTTDFGEYNNVAISMKQLKNKDYNIAEIIAKVLRRFFECLTNKDFDLLNEYRANCCTLMHNVMVVEPLSTYYAFAENIDENGMLIVHTTDNKVKIVSCGDVSIREVLN